MRKWKKFKGNYSISSDGKMRNDNTGRVLTGLKKKGYHLYGLRLKRNGSKRTVQVRAHRAVAEAFIGPIDGKHVHHVDANKLNNHVDNLEIVSHKTNLEFKTMSAVIECPCCGCKINMAITGTS